MKTRRAVFIEALLIAVFSIGAAVTVIAFWYVLFVTIAEHNVR